MIRSKRACGFAMSDDLSIPGMLWQCLLTGLYPMSILVAGADAPHGYTKRSRRTCERLENMTEAGFDIDESDVDDNVCSRCDGEGWILGDCFEDTCCCEDPETEHDMIPCHFCNPGGQNP